MTTRRPPYSTRDPGRHLHIVDSATPPSGQEGLAEPATCDNCGAATRPGNWEWTTPPAGCVSIGGAFGLMHHDEIIDMIQQFAQREKAMHPLKRIMTVRVDGNLLLIETTDVHTARDIGEALRRTFQVDIKFYFGEAGHLVRVHWER